MEMNLPDYLKKKLNNYREVYMKYMEYTDDRDIDDDVLLNVALLSDMEYMINEIAKRER